MNSDILEGNWKQIKGKILARWGKLTSDDFDKAQGEISQLIGTIQEKYGHSKADVEQEIRTMFTKK